MANNSGMLSNRKRGNYEPRTSFDESKEKEQEKLKNKGPKPKNSFNQQKKNIKVSADIKDEIDAIKKINSLHYDYETIQFIIDKYLDNETESNKRRFKMYTEL
ncbi:hypothetical protein MOO46_07370 (plasmid) [Apilactobacillus apisilvae]|uniref:Replication-associated protein RepC n=1 Tax=Apilactobacillus apisilvae TaxID=2923364 RepID=A0ABY4PJ10_9LACO|nr:hypothetical protein [Apilactobacillus apisilvae]UQS85804.1 hypothetical protein MOO46_07370 [Apilactobacillus apisilvae]